MSEEAELQAKIAALAGKDTQGSKHGAFPLSDTDTAGRINQQKQGASPAPPNAYGGGYHHAPNRWTPYSQPQPSYPPRGRGYHKPPYPAHRNKTLVVNNNNNNSNATGAAASGAEATAGPSPDTPGWVSKRDRGHMQLINTSVYDQKMQQKQLDMEETAKEKQRRRNEQEKNKIIRHVQGATSAHPIAASSDTPRDLVINDLRFRVAADGSKLIRIFGEYPCHHLQRPATCLLNNTDGSNHDAQTTPKQAKVAGVTFHRSKNGNLYRAGLVKKKLRYSRTTPLRGSSNPILTPLYSVAKTTKSSKLCPKFTSTGTQFSKLSLARRRMTGSHKTNPLLKSVGRPCRLPLTLTTGICPYGPRCRFTHDINKIAVCQQLMRHGKCAAGEECNLSHDLTPERVPWCIHFIRGNCTNLDCRYLHVRPNASAPVCGPFATMGYCEKGAECDGRHVNECPDYANTGSCRNADCRLPHVDSVANKRRAEATKTAGRQGSPGANDSSDLSSDEEDYQEIDSDDVDSDDMDEEDVVMTGDGEQSHELSQQQDFISF